MLKKILGTVISLTLIASTFSGCGRTGSAGSGDIKIGVILALTGDVATYGTSGQKGIKLLEEQTNKNGGILGRNVKFVIVDDQGKSSNSATVGQKLIDEDKVVAVVGPLTSACCNAFAPIANQNKIPMITGTGTDTKITSNGEYTFRSCFIDPFQGTVISKFAAKNLNAKTAAILYNNGDDYSKGLADYFKANFEKLGGKVVDTEVYTKGDQDFNAQLTKIKAKNPEVLLLPDYYTTVATIAKQARTLGIKSTFLGGDGWDSAKLTEIGGDAVNGSYYSNHYSADDTSPDVVKFISDFKAKYNNETPDAMAVLNYDAAKILLQAIKSAGKTDPDSIKNALKKTDINVVSGHVTFDKDRNAIKSAVMLKVDNGKTSFAAKVDPDK